jgi:hypothetical protein
MPAHYDIDQQLTHDVAHQHVLRQPGAQVWYTHDARVGGPLRQKECMQALRRVHMQNVFSDGSVRGSDGDAPFGALQALCAGFGSVLVGSTHGANRVITTCA